MMYYRREKMYYFLGTIKIIFLELIKLLKVNEVEIKNISINYMKQNRFRT